MKKIKSLFKRDYESKDRLVYNEVVEGCEWVLEGEGIATRKYDGTSCMIKEGVLYKRYDAKNGKKPPKGFIPAQDPDPITGHWPGWIVVDFSKPENKYHKQAFELEADIQEYMELEEGTYELCGPKINGNPEHFDFHVLWCEGY